MAASTKPTTRHVTWAIRTRRTHRARCDGGSLALPSRSGDKSSAGARNMKSAIDCTSASSSRRWPSSFDGGLYARRRRPRLGASREAAPFPRGRFCPRTNPDSGLSPRKRDRWRTTKLDLDRCTGTRPGNLDILVIWGQGHPDVDRSWGRTLRRCLLVWAEGHAARERPPAARGHAPGDASARRSLPDPEHPTRARADSRGDHPVSQQYVARRAAGRCKPARSTQPVRSSTCARCFRALAAMQCR